MQFRIAFALFALFVADARADETPAASARIVLQSVVTAGIRHHDAKVIWDYLAVGDLVQLVREPGNPHDQNAVRVDWNKFVLGYLPRSENRFVARQLDRGNVLRGRISAVSVYRNHRRKLEVEIFSPI